MKKFLSILVVLSMLVCVLPMGALADDEMILHYDFEESGVASDVSGAEADGIIKGGVTVHDGYAVFDGKDGYIEMPEGILEGHDEITIAMNVCPQIYKKHQFTFNFGNEGQNGYLFLNTSRPDDKLYAAITPTNYSGEAAAQAEPGVQSNKFASVILVINGKTMQLYRDAQLVAQNDSLPISVSELGKTNQNWLGKSPYNDAYFSGAIADFRIYSSALSAERVRFVDDQMNKDRNNYKMYLDVNSLSFERTDAVTEDLELVKTGAESGAQISWTSSEPQIISDSGKITRGESDKNVTMTAKIESGAVSYEKSFDFTVLKQPSAEEILVSKLNSITLPSKVKSLKIADYIPMGYTYKYDGLDENNGILTAHENGSYIITVMIGAGAASASREFKVEFTDSEQTMPEKTVSLYPEQASPFGEFEGWGTSLCWWANYIGYSDKLTEKAARYFFDPNEGLGLNIVRYNIGGGDDPTHTHIKDGRPDGNMPGFAKLDNEGNMYYDWTADENQMKVLKAAIDKGVDNVEAFSNSAPYFMTISGCSSGGHDASVDNISADKFDEFSLFLCDVIKHFKEEEGIEFDSISPFNEPDTSYWGYGSSKQEGMHVSPGESQSGIVNSLYKKLSENGIDITLSATEETDLGKAYKNFEALDESAKAAVDRINAHTYSGNAREEVKDTAAKYGKSLWMSEVDGKFVAGENAGNMAPALGLGRRITIDMNGMQPTAWIIWQIVDSHRDNIFYTNNNLQFSDDGYWGTAIADHVTGDILRSKKYYAFGQYTKYIKKGMTLIGSNDEGDSVVAYDNDKIVIVSTNRTGAEQNIEYDLSDFDGSFTAADVIRTSEKENWAQLESVSVEGDRFTVSQPGGTITTYVIHGSNISPKTDLPEAEILSMQLSDYGTYLKGSITSPENGTAVVNFYDNGGTLMDSCAAKAENGVIPVKTTALAYSEARAYINGKIYRVE